MIELTFKADNAKSLFANVKEFVVGYLPEEEYTLAALPEIEPVLTQKQMEENIKNAPEHVMPEQPTLDEVRAALKALRDRKGSAAVKQLLSAYGVESVPDLKPEDYLGARDRALAEV